MKSLLMLCILLMFSCEKKDDFLKIYRQKWTLIATKIGEAPWETAPAGEQFILNFESDSSFSYSKKEINCAGTQTFKKDGKLSTLTLRANCMTPSPHMYWTYQIDSETSSEIVVKPRLNPTAFLSNMKYKFRVN